MAKTKTTEKREKLLKPVPVCLDAETYNFFKARADADRRPLGPRLRLELQDLRQMLQQEECA